MTDLKLSQDIKVLTFFQYIKDDWYGQRYRVILINDNHTGFKNLKEIKSYRKSFLNYIKQKHNWKGTIRDLEFGTLESFPTYKYVSCGPSYSCTNIYVTLSEIKNLIQVK